MTECKKREESDRLENSNWWVTARLNRLCKFCDRIKGAVALAPRIDPYSLRQRYDTLD
jgi:hypothetical protein